MNPAAHVRILGHLVRDTFRQAHASGISWMMLAVTAVCAVVCLSASISGDVSLKEGEEPVLFLPSTSSGAVAPPIESPGKERRPVLPDPALARREGLEVVGGRVTLAFGAVSFPLGRDRGDAVHFLELLLGGGVAGTFGILMALVWTAGFAPTFLEPAAASVLLAKPVARIELLLGKYLGVLAFVAVQVALFVATTWAALGARTGVWDAAYLACVPLLLVEFAIFYSASMLLAVLTRSTVACVFGSLLYWLLAWAVNYGRIAVRAAAGGPDAFPAATSTAAEAAYWVFPKPIDAGLTLFNALDARHHFAKPAMFTMLESSHAFWPGLSVLSSLVLAACLLALAGHELSATDY